MQHSFSMGTIHFVTKASADLRSALMASADAAGVPWCVAIRVIARMVLHSCKAAATAQMMVLASWSPDRWIEQEEVREAQHTAKENQERCGQ